jgi:hypothetical protein
MFPTRASAIAGHKKERTSLQCERRGGRRGVGQQKQRHARTTEATTTPAQTWTTSPSAPLVARCERSASPRESRVRLRAGNVVPRYEFARTLSPHGADHHQSGTRAALLGSSTRSLCAAHRIEARVLPTCRHRGSWQTSPRAKHQRVKRAVAPRASEERNAASHVCRGLVSAPAGRGKRDQ